MANQNTTFHAKITADARQFIEQVEGASQSLEQLVSVYNKVSKDATSASSKAATGAQGNAQKEVKDIFNVAKKEQEALHQAAMQDERELAAVRKSSAGTGDDAFGEAGARARAKVEQRAEDMRQKALDDRLKTHRTYSDQVFDFITRSTAAERQADQREQQGLREQLMLRDKMNKAHRAAILEDRRIEERRERDVARANRSQMDAMVTGRYALYDMANAYRGVFDVAQRVTRELLTTVKAAADFESSFTAVERALKLDSGSQAFMELRENLIALSREIPVTFEEISEIAALGGQMGVANEDVEKFTETVAAFTATTGVSAEEAATKFGRIAALLQVPVSEFENLGSAIVFAGFNAVATEDEILSMTQSIAASASKAGFAADETVGLATALASLALAPELSRGALQRIFGEIEQAVQGTSGYLDDFARVMGTTEDRVAFLWQEDPSQFFFDLNKAIRESGDIGGALDSIGIVNIRDVELMTRLAQGTETYNKSLNDSLDSYTEGTALAEYYAKSADDLNSGFIKLSNAFSAFQAALGSGLAESLGPFLDILIDILASATDFASTDFGKAVIPITVAITAAVAAFAGFSYIINIATAQLFAMRTAQIKMAEMTGTATLGFKALYNQLIGNVYVYRSATNEVQFLTKAQMKAGVAADLLEKKLVDQAIAAGVASKATRGLGISLTALGAVSTLGVIVTLGAILLNARTSMDLFGKDAERTAEKLRELGQAGIQSAGGLDAFRRAMEADTDSARPAALDKLEEAQNKVNEAMEMGIDIHDTYAKTFGKGVEPDLAEAKIKGDEYRKILAESLLIPDGDDVVSFVDKFLEIDSATEGAISALGFDYVAMIDAAIADNADGQGAQAYAEQFAINLRNFMALGYDSVADLQRDFDEGLISDAAFQRALPVLTQFEALAEDAGISMSELRRNLSASDVESFVEGMDSAAAAVDATNAEVDRQIRSQEDLESRLAATAEEVENSAEQYEELNKQMKEYIGNVGIVEAGNQKTFSSFGALALGVNQTEAGFTGLGEAAADNLSNLQSFISAAFTSSFAEGTGVVGGLERVSAAIYVLGQQGADTGEIWSVARELFVNSLTLMGGQYAVLAQQLSVAPDFKAAEIIISGFINAADAAGQLTPALIANINALRSAMAGESDFVTEFKNAFEDALKAVRVSSNRTKTALEKLQDSLKDTFSWTKQQMGISSSLRDLGESLEENGNTFNIWNKEGEENVNGLMDVIDELANRSGGNMQTFANLLASLRVALKDMGVGASGLRYIDVALAETGKTGRATDSVVQRLTNSLMDIGDAEDEIKTVEEAIEAVSSAATSGIRNRFAQAFAIDDITLGWLDMEDAIKDAAEEIENFEEQIESAREEIEDARIAIDEANASIQDLTADRGRLEYQLSVALRYGDMLRAEQIRADISKIDADIAKESQNITKANSDISSAQGDIAEAEQGIVDIRTQSTRETIEANRALTEMAEKYANATAYMIINADEGEDLNQIIDDQVEAFKQNAIQMGYTEEQAQAVADILREELIKSMEEIPENIETEINAETSAALSAVQSFVRDANDRLAQIDRNIIITTSYVEERRTASGGAGGNFAYMSAGGLVTGPGSSTSDSIAARLSDGEYVLRASAVEKYGVPFLNALNQQRVTSAMMSAPASSVVSGGGVMSLSPEDRALLRAALDRPVTLYTDNTVIAKSANDGNQVLAQRGLK